MKGAKPKLSVVIPMKGEELEAADLAPIPPYELSDRGLAAWDRLAPLMVKKQRLEPHFYDMFAVYCEAAADVMDLSIEIATEGRTYEVQTRNGLQQKKTAAWQSRQDALATMKQFGALFGLNPVDEARLGSAEQGDLFAEMARVINGAD